MYLYHFGMRELPFTITPNTNFYCGLQAHDEALQVLLTALKTGEGFIKVTGEVGTGKTLLCRKLLNELPDHFITAYVPNPFLNPYELRRAVASELGVLTSQANTQPGSNTVDHLELAERIQQRLLDINRAGKTVVVIIDEAQALPEESLETLRLFSNLETEQRKLVHLVLFGQPELDERLATQSLRQLRQRIGFSYQLRSMTAAEVGQYIHHRLQVAGYQGVELFPPAVVKKLHKASRGVPRLVNILSHKCLLLTFGRDTPQVNQWALRQAVADTADAKSSNLITRWLLPGAVATVAMLTTAMFVAQGVSV